MLSRDNSQISVYEGQDLIMGRQIKEDSESSQVIETSEIINEDSMLTYQQKRNQQRRKRYREAHK